MLEGGEQNFTSELSLMNTNVSTVLSNIVGSQNFNLSPSALAYLSLVPRYHCTLINVTLFANWAMILATHRHFPDLCFFENCRSFLCTKMWC